MKDHRAEAQRRRDSFIFFPRPSRLRASARGFLLLCLFIFLACMRDDKKVDVVVEKTTTGALPSAILQPGEHPIWFQLTERGPIYIESIEDAVNTTAFIPWPLAVHIRFFHERENELVMAVNRDGFMKLTPQKDGIAFYHFTGGNYWKNFTVGGFINYDKQDVALLYIDDRFLDTTLKITNQRTWTFNMDSNTPFAITIPALELFPAQDGWDVDALRLSSDGYWYYRVRKRSAPQPEIQMIKTENLAQAGISISIEDFFNSAPLKPVINDPALPVLPAGFVYTGIGHVGNSVFASWEEQDEFNIGAAGFMLVRR